MVVPFTRSLPHQLFIPRISTQSQCCSRLLGPQRQASTFLKLRPYQQECIEAVLDYVSKGERRLGISLATGSGKTVIFSHLIDQIPAPTKNATQTLIIAHRRELVEQAAKHCRALYPEKNVEVEMGSSSASGVADITVASVASLVSGERLLKFDPDRFKLVLVDEAHHIVAPSYLEILRHFNLIQDIQKARTVLVGVSATFSREDGLSLGKAIDHIVYHKDYLDFIQDDWLSNLIFTTVKTGADLSKVRSSRGDFQTGSLSKAVNTQENNALIVRSWLAKASQRKSTLVFCVDLAHVASLTAMFRHHGIDAQFITGDTDAKVRAERLEAFKAGKHPVLINCGIFTEGTDIPNIDCVVLARPTKSRNLLVQMIGRGLRKYENKENCHVLDFVASLKTGITTTPTLFGLDPDELVEDADATTLRNLKERRESEQVRELASKPQNLPIGQFSDSSKLVGNVIFTDYDDVNELIEDTSGERHIRAISPHAWVQVGDGVYIVSATGGDYMTIKHTGTSFEVIFTRKLNLKTESSKYPYARPRLLATVQRFGEAVRAADKFAKEKMPFFAISKNASWRRTPASDTQIAFINKIRDESEKLEKGSITKGQAADWITKIKHGARGRFNKITIAKRKAERITMKKDKFQEMQRKAQVKVGPVAKEEDMEL